MTDDPNSAQVASNVAEKHSSESEYELERRLRRRTNPKPRQFVREKKTHDHDDNLAEDDESGGDTEEVVEDGRSF